MDSTGVPKPDLTPIRKRRDYHPNARKTGVCWGPRRWFRDDSWSRGAVETSPALKAHSEIPTRKTDAWGTHQNAARTSVRHLKQASQSHPERTNRAYIYFIAKVKLCWFSLKWKEVARLDLQRTFTTCRCVR